MKPEELKERDFESEFVFTATRSGGPGGQNVNKVNTKVELRFSIKETLLLSEEEKSLAFSKLGNRINKEGEVIIISQSERSQFSNREEAKEKFYDLLSRALTVHKKRKPTSPTRSSRLKRLEDKHNRSTIKKLRRDTGSEQVE